MSAPPSGSSGSSPSPSSPSPAPGYYPDPSIPNYIRYWNGSAWVPGTSRPAPVDATPDNPTGAPAPAPAPATAWPAAAGSAPAPQGPPAGGAAPDPGARGVEESGPMFLDEDPAAPRADAGPAGVPVQGGAAGHRGSGYDRSGQDSAGYAGSGYDRSGQGRAGYDGSGQDSAGYDGSARDPRSGSGQDAAPAWPPMQEPGQQLPRISWGAAGADAGAASAAPAAQAPPGAQAVPGQAGAPAAESRAPAASPAGPADPAAPSAVPGGPAPGHAPQAPPAPLGPRIPPAPLPGQQAQPAPGQPAPAGHSDPAGQPAAGRPAAPWAAQVHDLAQPPWRPVPSDPFGAAQGHDRPGGLVRRFAARVIDGVLLAAVTGAAAVPLGSAAYHHAKDKVDQAKLTGETVKVWLLDGTTGADLAAVVGVLLVAGLLLEVLPTARWGRTLGKKLVGLQVLDIEGQLPPGFGASLRRWVTHTLLGLTVVGLLGSAWGLFDRPWKQGLHDKAARTFVAQA